MIQGVRELIDKTLKGLQKCYKFSKGDHRVCYGCPYNEKGEDCFIILISNAYYLVQTVKIWAEEEESQNDK